MAEHRRILIDGRPVPALLEDGHLVTEHGERLPIADAHHLPPVEPTKIIATHLTYRSRVEEFMTTLPPAPTYFQKPTSSLNGALGESWYARLDAGT